MSPRCPRNISRERRLPSSATDAAHAALPGRVLLVVVGSMRGAPTSWESMERLLLRPHRAELMLVLAEPAVDALREAARQGHTPPTPSIGLGSMTLAQAAFHFHAHLARHALHVVSVPEYADYGSALDLMQQTVLADGYRLPKERRPWRERAVPCPGAPWVASPLGGVANATCVLPGRSGVVQPLKSTGSAAIGVPMHLRPHCRPVPCGRAPRSQHSPTHHTPWRRAALSCRARAVGVYRWFAKRALLEYGLLSRYDWFIHTRTDTHMLCAPPLPSHALLDAALHEAGTRGVAIVPVGEDWGGLTERFLIGSRQAILPALTTLEHWVVGRASLAANSETQLRRSLVKACVRVLRVPRTTFVLQRVASDRRVRRRSSGAAELPSFERTRSNWGGCMHAASHIDVYSFGMPTRWGQWRVAVPSEMRAMHVCPKYAAAWWLAQQTCTNATSRPDRAGSVAASRAAATSPGGQAHDA